MYQRFKGIHSDHARRVLRGIPADVALVLTDEQLEALVASIYALMIHECDRAREEVSNA